MYHKHMHTAKSSYIQTVPGVVNLERMLTKNVCIHACIRRYFVGGGKNEVK
jgi:hypothetical protein